MWGTLGTDSNCVKGNNGTTLPVGKTPTPLHWSSPSATIAEVIDSGAAGNFIGNWSKPLRCPCSAKGCDWTVLHASFSVNSDFIFLCGTMPHTPDGNVVHNGAFWVWKIFTSV